MTRSLKTILSILAIASVLTDCGGGSSSSGSDVKTLVRLVNVSPGTGNVKVALAGVVATSSLPYHDASGYLDVASGTPELTVYSATTGALLYDVTNVAVASGTRSTIFIFGGSTGVTATLLPDDTTAASAGHTSLRLSHSATGIGALDLYLLPAGKSIQDAAPAYSSLGYAATTPFSEYASGSYSVILTPAGTKDIVYDSGAQTLPETGRVTVLVLGTGSGKLANVAMLQDDGSGTTAFIDNRYARFRFVNANPEAQAADVLVDGAVAFAGIPLGGWSAYGSVGAGSRDIKVQSSSVPGAYFYDDTRVLNAGFDYSLVVYGAAGGRPAGLLALQDNNLPPATGMAKLRFVNAISDGSACDAYVNDVVSLSNMGFATGSAYQEVAAGAFTLGFGPAGTGQQAARLPGQQLEAGHIYTVYLYGRGGNEVAVLAQDG